MVRRESENLRVKPGGAFEILGGDRDVSEATLAAVSAAGQCAVVAFDKRPRNTPMKDSPAAAGVGIRLRGSSPSSP